MRHDPSAWTHLPLPRRLWWPWDDAAPVVAFRSLFTVERDTLATLHMVSSGPVRVWLDGEELELLGQPLPCWRTVRRATVTLGGGEHCLDIEAHAGDHGQPFVLGSLDWDEDGDLTRLATDDGWTMTRAPLAGWQTTSSPLQRSAWAFDGVWAEPWGFPCDAPDDYLRLSTGWQQVVSGPLDTVAQAFSGVSALGAECDSTNPRAVTFTPARPSPGSGPMLDPVRRHGLWQYAREAHAITTNDWLDIFEARAPHVVFDVGAETFARVKVTSRSSGKVMLAVTTGESLGEVKHHGRRLTDVVVLEEGETFATCPAGFRYVKIVALAAEGGAVTLDTPQVQHVRFGAAVTGRFECSDEKLTRVWQTAAHTALLCMQNELWDGVKRDQRPWMGDLHVEALTSYHLFDDARLVARSLAVLSELGPAPGLPLEQQRYPGLRAAWQTTTGDINDIPSYTLWWVIGLHDYYRHTGDRTLVMEVADALDATLRHIVGWTDEHGCWRFHGGWDLVDWAPLTASERELYCHLLATTAVRDGAALLEGLGWPVDAYLARASKMTKAARAQLTGRLDQPLPHHLAAIAVLSGVLSEAEAETLFGASLQHDPQMTMTFWHRFNDLRAAAELGRVQWGLDYLRKHWGIMLDLGATTFWEAFDPAWIHAPDPHAVSMIAGEHAMYGGYGTSLCHGWSAGPAAWLSATVLGITPAAPGFRAARFRPELGDLTWASGTIPTPHGLIHVELRRDNDGQKAVVHAPANVTLSISAEVRGEWTVYQTAPTLAERTVSS